MSRPEVCAGCASRLRADALACDECGEPVTVGRCWNCGDPVCAGEGFAFPDSDGCAVHACGPCKAAVRAHCRTERAAFRSDARRSRGRARLRDFRERAKQGRAWVRFVTMHAACAVLGGER